MGTTAANLRRWTRDEYYRMAEAGLFNGQRVELIDGEITNMSPRNRRHSTAIMLAARAMQNAFGPACSVQVQLPLALDPDNEPEPDIAVVPGQPRDYTDHPSTALLVLEVAESSLAFDTTTKAGLYAAHAIADYWVVNLVDRTLMVHRDPVADATAPLGHRYAGVTIYAAIASAAPLAAPSASIAVADLLP